MQCGGRFWYVFRVDGGSGGRVYQSRGTEHRVAQALTWLRELDRRSPTKHSQRWVVVPQALAFDRSLPEPDPPWLPDDPMLAEDVGERQPPRCPACRFAALKDHDASRHEWRSTRESSNLSRG